MAKIGVSEFRYSVLTETGGTATYNGAKKPAHAISCNVSVETNDARLYGDDVLIESDSSFRGGTVTIGLDEDDMEMYAELLGHTLTDGEMKRNAEDVAPYVGIGHIVTKRKDGVVSYKVEFLRKVQFGEPSQENTTKGENLEFGTYELEGAVMALANGDWSCAKSFTDKTAAIAYLEGLLAKPTP